MTHCGWCGYRAMRDSTPLFIKDFISDMIRNDVARYFEELKVGFWAKGIFSQRMNRVIVDSDLEYRKHFDCNSIFEYQKIKYNTKRCKG